MNGANDIPILFSRGGGYDGDSDGRILETTTTTTVNVTNNSSNSGQQQQQQLDDDDKESTAVEEEQGDRHLVRFAMVPQHTENPFYRVVQEGCEYQAQKMSSLSVKVECLFLGPQFVDAEEQASIVRNLIINNATNTTPSNFRIHGIAMAVRNATLTTTLAEQAFQESIPFVTFDSDAPQSRRSYYIGTDNYGFGKSLAKVLLQLQSSKEEGQRLQQYQEQQQQQTSSSSSLPTRSRRL